MPFWPFKKPFKVEPLDVAELQIQLVQKAHSASPKEFKKFCRAYQSQIESNAHVLKIVPEAVRDDPEQCDYFAQGLIQAAFFLNENLNSPVLLNTFSMKQDENPFEKWNDFREQITERLENHEHAQVVDELRDLIQKIQNYKGDSALQYEALVNGDLGSVLFKSGNAKEAEAPFNRALELCEQIGDSQGVAIYLRNLLEIARYLGDSDKTISCAERLVAELENQQSSDTAEAKSQLELLKSGEPLCRIICRKGGQIVEPANMVPETGVRVSFEYVRNRPSFQLVGLLVQEGNAKAAKGDLADALELYHQANEIDPYDPDPLYQSGMALMELGSYSQALETYQEVEKLAPGWFHCRFDGWLAGHLEAGKIPSEVLEIWRALVDGGGDLAELSEISKMAIDRFPEFAPFWRRYGDLQREQNLSDEAERAYRKGLEFVEDAETESHLLAALAGMMPPEANARKEIIERCLKLEGNLMAQATAQLLKNINHL